MTGLDRAHWRESDGLAHVIADAFHDLPQTEWLVPDPVARREVMPAFFRLLIDHAMSAGAVYTTRRRTAAAVWLPIAPGFTPVPPDQDRRLRAAVGEHIDRFRTFETVREKHHPHGAAHHYLAILAVAEPHRNAGIGSALLRSYHDMLDREQVPAYLEAATPRSRELYLRHGYADLGGPFHLPDGPAMWPMWRPPHEPAASQAGP